MPCNHALVACAPSLLLTQLSSVKRCVRACALSFKIAFASTSRSYLHLRNNSRSLNICEISVCLHLREGGYLKQRILLPNNPNGCCCKEFVRLSNGLKLCRTSSHGSLMVLSNLHALADDASRLILASARPLLVFSKSPWAIPFVCQPRLWQPFVQPTLSGRPQLASPRTTEQVVTVLPGR